MAKDWEEGSGVEAWRRGEERRVVRVLSERFLWSWREGAVEMVAREVGCVMWEC
jgi:hypothetical protein